jgi:hypothetical protein
MAKHEIKAKMASAISEMARHQRRKSIKWHGNGEAKAKYQHGMAASVALISGISHQRNAMAWSSERRRASVSSVSIAAQWRSISGEGEMKIAGGVAWQ